MGKVRKEGNQSAAVVTLQFPALADEPRLAVASQMCPSPLHYGPSKHCH